MPGLALQAPTSEAVKCQAIVDALNVHLFPHVTLDHIQGAAVAQLDQLSIKNLLDIFSVLFHIPPATPDSEDGSREGTCDDYSDDSGNESVNRNEANDSNVISSEGMSVISEVLREELGHSSHSAVTDSTTELMRPVPAARLPTGLIKTATTKEVQTFTEFQCSGESSSVVSRSNESTAVNLPPPSLTISSLQTTSTEEGSYLQGVTSQAGEMPQDGASTAANTNRLQEEAAPSSAVTETRAPISTFVPSGESSIGTTPSPKQLHTPPRSPQQHHSLSPLHHSTPHTSTRSRLFPFSSSTSTAISSHSCSHSHPLATVTPSVTVSNKHREHTDTHSTRDGEEGRVHKKITRSADLTDESTLVPESPPTQHAYPRLIPDLTITDLHTTTMSSEGGGACSDAAHGRELKQANAYQSSSEDSESTNSETPPHSKQPSPQRVAQPSLTVSRTPLPRGTTAAQKVRFSQSTEQRERTRHGCSLSASSSKHPSCEVGDLSSIQLKLGRGDRMAQSRASVLATLYQNYLKTAQPATLTANKTSTTKSSSSKSKPRSYSRPMSKVCNTTLYSTKTSVLSPQFFVSGKTLVLCCNILSLVGKECLLQHGLT